MSKRQDELLSAYIDALLSHGEATPDFALDPAVAGMARLLAEAADDVQPRPGFREELGERLAVTVAGSPLPGKNGRAAALPGEPVVAVLPAAPATPRGGVRAGRSRPRVALLVAAALALLVLAGACYALAPLVSDLWQRHTGLNRTTEQGLDREIGLALTVNGVTVRLERGYADPNWIALGYAIDATGLPEGMCLDDAGPRKQLRDAAGHEFDHFSGGGYAPIFPARLGAAVAGFDATTARLQGPEVALTLTFPGLGLRRCDATGPRTPEEAVNPDAVLPGPWTFNFSLPVAPARVTEPRLSASAGGVVITLERVSSSPVETVYWLRAAPESGREDEYQRDWMLIPAPGPSGMWGMGSLVGDRITYRVGAPLPPGTTQTLEVREVMPSRLFEGQNRISGPWRFEFDLPDAQTPEQRSRASLREEGVAGYAD